MLKGIFDKKRLVINILLILLVALNVFFSIQYNQNLKKKDEAQIAQAQKIEYRLQTAQFMKLFIDKVLSTNGEISYDDRKKLEDDVRALGDETLIKQWEVFSASSGTSTQPAVIKLMSMLSNRMI
jgi:Ca2+/Na+ antiporter